MESREAWFRRLELAWLEDDEDPIPVLKEEIRRTDKELAEVRHYKDAAYQERNRCVAAIAQLALVMGWRAGLALHPESDTTWAADWRTIVWIELPTGQVTWHVNDSEAGLFSFLKHGPFAWDGHSTSEKYDRLEGLSHKRIREGAGDGG